jgi:Glycosyl transferases group 1
MPKKPLVISSRGGKSQYNAFVRFQEFYLEGFKQLGYDVRYLTSYLSLNHQEILNGFVTYFACINSSVLWNIYRTFPTLPISNNIIDHPFDSFYPSDNEGYPPSYFPISFDPTWIEFFGRYRKQSTSPPLAASHTPLAGFIHPEVVKLKAASRRRMKVLFAGSTVDLNILRQSWRTQAPTMAQVIDTVVEHTTANYGIQLDLMLEQGLNPECAKDVHCISTIFRHANEYTRAHYRLKLLRTLAQAGVPATVYSNHPDLLNKLVGKHRFEVRPPVDFMDLLKLMAQSKMVLNCRPNTQGMTERVPSTMLNGAVSINDTNNYLAQEFVDGQEAIFYDYQKLEELPDKIFHLLSHPDELDAIATAGQRKAQERHTVLHRAQTILDSVEQFRAMLLNAHQHS